MEYVNLGKSGLRISRLCLGTGNFGSNTDEASSNAIMDRALDAGINLFDTGDVYGGKERSDSHLPGGLTEAIIGRWLAKDKSRRAKIVLCTKVWGIMGPGPNDRGLSAYHIRRACEESLRRLQTTHIDLYQMHAPDPSTPVEEIWQAMEQLVQEGKILYVGSSNFPAWMVVYAQMVAQSRNLMGLASEQSRYNLADRRAEKELLPALRKMGIGMIAYSPLGGGLLGGSLDKATHGQRANAFVRYDKGRYGGELVQWESFCRALGEPPARVAIAWILSNPGITAPIIGPRTVAQLEETLAGLALHLDGEALQKLDEIWPCR